MSGKDAKLAAARKRAEALKSKKASSINLQVKTDESDSSNDLVRPIEGEDVHTEIKHQDTAIGPNEAQNVWRLRALDAEKSLVLRDEQIQAMELELSRMEKSAEEPQLIRTKTFKNSAILEPRSQSDVIAVAADNAQVSGPVDELEQTIRDEGDTELSTLRNKNAALEEQVAQLVIKISDLAGTHQARSKEERHKADSLQRENKGLLAQLSHLRAQVLSLEDEKLALSESLTKIHREPKQKGMIGSSLDPARTKISKEFYRSKTLEDIDFLDEARDPALRPADLVNSIQIDLVFWYDKHAGEVIEV